MKFYKRCAPADSIRSAIGYAFSNASRIFRRTGALLILCLLTAAECGAADTIENRYEVGASAGYAQAFRFAANEPNNRKSVLLPLFAWWSMPLPHHLRLVIEPNAGIFDRLTGGSMAGLNTTMVGVNAALRYYPLASGRVLPFIGGGVGVLYTGFAQLGSPVDFSVYPETGLHFLLTDRMSLVTGYRMYHISNGHLRSPNVGINYHLVTLGISWFYGDAKKG